MAARGDKSSGMMRGEKYFKFKGVSGKGVVVEVKSASKEKEKCCYVTFPSGTSHAPLAIFRDLFLLLNDPDVVERNLNLEMVVDFLGSSLTIDKSFYQEFIENIPLEFLTKKEELKEELWAKAKEAYNLLVEKVSIGGRRRADEADLLLAIVETGNCSASPAEALQQMTISKEVAERACKEKDAENKELRRKFKNSKSACKKMDAELRELRNEVSEKAADIVSLKNALYGANAKVDGQPLKRRATRELQRGGASTSKDGSPAFGDDMGALLADKDFSNLIAGIDGLMARNPLPEIK